jgi:hypothetical protein
LQRTLRRRLRRAIEVQQPRLRAGVEFELERLIVLPRDRIRPGCRMMPPTP